MYHVNEQKLISIQTRRKLLFTGPSAFLAQSLLMKWVTMYMEF